MQGLSGIYKHVYYYTYVLPDGFAEYSTSLIHYEAKYVSISKYILYPFFITDCQPSINLIFKDERLPRIKEKKKK